MADHKVELDFQTKQTVAGLAALVCAGGFGFASFKFMLFNPFVVALLAGIVGLALSYWRAQYGVIAILAAIGAVVIGIYFDPFRY